MSRRKRLIGLKKLDEGNELLDMGVPMTKVHVRLKLNELWSYQSTADIFAADRLGLSSITRPPWLEEEPHLQEAPQGWIFEGVFPHGEWVNRNEIQGE